MTDKVAQMIKSLQHYVFFFLTSEKATLTPVRNTNKKKTFSTASNKNGHIYTYDISTSIK